MKIKKILNNLSYSVLANGSNTLISMLLVLFVPKILGVKEYAYWQLYLFYTSYVGFFHLGWADGVYLRFGGKKYSELDKGYFRTQFWLLVVMEIIFSILIGIFAVSCVADEQKQIVLVCMGVCCILQIPRTFLQYLLQTTDRIVDYAKNYMLEKIVYACLVIILLLIGVREFQYLVFSDMFARLVTLLLLSRECKDIVIGKLGDIKIGIHEAWENINIGSKLMFANIASQLVLGIVRWAIQNHWSVETFGKVSLSITASNLLMVLISAVSIVLYPMLKNISEDKYADIYFKMRDVLMIAVLGMLLVYYPAKVILSWWLPQYAESLKYMALLFPICIFDSKMTMIVTTYLKVLRKEKTIMTINWGVVGITLVSTGILVYGLDNMLATICSITILLGIRSTIGEIVLCHYLKCSAQKDILIEWLLIISFMVISWCTDSYIAFFGYGIMYLGYVFWKRRQLKEIIVGIVKKTD